MSARPTPARLLAFAAATAACAALAQPYPAKPVKIIVAFTAGGTTDIMARTVGPMAVNPTLYKGLPYNPVTDLVPVAQISDVPNVLVVHPSTGVKTMEDFVKYAKANPGRVNYASTGIGTSSHLSSYMLAARAGFEATHIPYKGAEALKDLLTGRVQMMFATIPSVIAHIKAGNLTAIAVSSAKRSRSMPDVPTVAEKGFPGFEAGSWFGFFAPRGTPPEVIATLNKAVNEVIAEKAVESRMIDEGADPAAVTPEKFGAFVKGEHEKWAKVVRESGAKVD